MAKNVFFSDLSPPQFLLIQRLQLMTGLIWLSMKKSLIKERLGFGSSMLIETVNVSILFVLYDLNNLIIFIVLVTVGKTW